MQPFNSQSTISDSQSETSSTSSLGYPGNQPSFIHPPSHLQTRFGQSIDNTASSNATGGGSALIKVHTRKRAAMNEDVSDAANSGLYLRTGKRTRRRPVGQESPPSHPQESHRRSERNTTRKPDTKKVAPRSFRIDTLITRWWSHRTAEVSETQASQLDEREIICRSTTRVVTLGNFGIPNHLHASELS